MSNHGAPTITRHAFGDVHIDAADLKVGDVIHHWSSRGGIWTVRRIDSFGVLTLTSDMGAVRRFTPEQIDAKGAWLSHKAPITEPLRYDPELAERAAIQADAENERDGYRD